LWIALSWAAADSLAAQAPAVQGSPERVRAFEEAIDVRVVNLEAVVTDRRGERVSGLTVEDFKLLVDGVETPIAYFSEIAEERLAAPAKASQTATWQARNILVFLDESTMVKARRMRGSISPSSSAGRSTASSSPSTTRSPVKRYGGRRSCRRCRGASERHGVHS
jgi:hypothetical protein